MKRYTPLRTLALGIAFGCLIVALCGLLGSGAATGSVKHDLSFVYLVLPIPLAFAVCFFMRRKVFCFSKEHIRKRQSWKRFILRLSVVPIVLIGGYIPSIQHWDGGYLVDFILCNYFFYVIIAIFLLSFSVIELIFVP